MPKQRFGDIIILVLTGDGLDHCDEALGSWPLKTMQCKVKKYETGASLPL